MPDEDFSIDDPRFNAALDMIGRTGAQSMQIRFQDDEEPTVWIAVAQYGVDENHVPQPEGGEITYKIGAALHPVHALMELLNQAVDGGECTYCHRGTAITLHVGPMPF